jgi:hypothetical protein
MDGRIVTAASPVHLPRYRPHAKAIFGRRPPHLCPGCAAQPCFEAWAIQKDRHPVVNRPHEGVRVRDDHGAGQHGFAGVGAVPASQRPAMLSTLPSGIVFHSKWPELGFGLQG